MPNWRLKTSKQITCGRQCSSVNMSLRRIEEIEKQANIKNLYDFIKVEYEANMKSIRQISTMIFGKETYASTISSYMDLFNIKKRQGSEAIKTQWLNNDKRKKKQAKLAVKYMGEGTKSRSNLKETMQTQEYRLKSSLAKRGIKNPMYGVTGEAHPNWDPERTNEQRTEERKLFLDREWRLSVFERDSYTCQCCGYDKGGILVAHHLNGYHWDIKNRHNVDNGIALCEPCHIDFHGEYGYMNNTKEQFNEYMNKRLALL